VPFSRATAAPGEMWFRCVGETTQCPPERPCRPR